MHYRLDIGVWWDYELGVAHCTGLDCIGRLSLVDRLFILDCGPLMDVILDPKTPNVSRSICVKPGDGLCNVQSASLCNILTTPLHSNSRLHNACFMTNPLPLHGS